MENIYQLTGRFCELSNQYDELANQLDAIYEENGGECTEQTDYTEAVIAAIVELKKQIASDIIENADRYAEIALNKAAQRKQLEAQLKALKEEQAKVVERFTSKINALARKEAFWKENFDEAMHFADITKIGGAKTNALHSIYYQRSKTLNVDEEMVMQPYEEVIAAATSQLPSWAKVEVTINKAELKKEGVLPEGATIVEKETVVIR